MDSCWWLQRVAWLRCRPAAFARPPATAPRTLARKFELLLSHPSRKNNNAARVGHPHFFRKTEKTMLLAIHVGNTNTVLGLYKLEGESGSPATGLGRRGDAK